MKFTITIHIFYFLLLFLFCEIGNAQVIVTTDEGTYILDKAFSDYSTGVIMYESYRYSNPEDYKNDKIKAIELLTNSADSGYAPAQYYLGTIYLNDTLLKDYKKSIELLKKAAYHRNIDAEELLDKMGIKYEVAIDYEAIIKFWLLLISLSSYFILSFIAHIRIRKSDFITEKNKKRLKMLIWFVPYIGAIYGAINSKKMKILLNKKEIDWITNCFEWIKQEFGIETILNAEIIIPDNNNIPVKINSSEKSIKELVDFIAERMQIEKDSIEIHFYNQSTMDLGGNLFTKYEDEKYSSGVYWGKNENGKYEISLELSQFKIKNKTKLIATIAHELSHVKLLGEKRIKNNNEYLTDLIPIIFGFGIFNANSIFQYNQDSYGWSTSSQGYLNEPMYGFALAAFTNIRNDLNPFWSKYLSPTVREEFEKSIIYIKKNKNQ